MEPRGPALEPAIVRNERHPVLRLDTRVARPFEDDTPGPLGEEDRPDVRRGGGRGHLCEAAEHVELGEDRSGFEKDVGEAGGDVDDFLDEVPLLRLVGAVQGEPLGGKGFELRGCELGAVLGLGVG